MFALVVLTVFAPFIEPLCDDFRERPEIVAHRNARPVRKVVPRPRPVRPEPEDAARRRGAGRGHGGRTVPAGDRRPRLAVPFEQPSPRDTGAYADRRRGRRRSTAATGAPAFSGRRPATPSTTRRTRVPSTAGARDAAAPSAHQAFWALVPEERDVVDERDIPIFRIGPTAWALVIEDRGETFVVRHEDGRIGYLHDVSGVTRG